MRKRRILSQIKRMASFKISGDGVWLLVGYADDIRNLLIPKNISKWRSFFGSINQYEKIVSNLSTLSSPINPFLFKRSVYKWDNSHSNSKAFDKLVSESVKFTKNSPFDLREKIRLKTDDSHNGLGSTIE